MKSVITPTRRPQALLSGVVAVVLGLLVGLLVDMRSHLSLLLLCIAVGGVLGWLTRDGAGGLVADWQQVRSRRTPVLFRVYRVVGPWLLWAGLGAAAAMVVRTLVPA